MPVTLAVAPRVVTSSDVAGEHDSHGRPATAPVKSRSPSSRRAVEFGRSQAAGRWQPREEEPSLSIAVGR